ncbi:MAG TPA: hypothetical protein VJV78_45770 [Polyangiales bacterium]|nr:hypothetical protein [Polyangiales bacterium]
MRRWLGSWLVCACLCGSAHAEPALQVEFRTTPADKLLDGRLLLLLSTDDKAEPRTQIDPTLASQLVFGADIEDLRERTLTCPRVRSPATRSARSPTWRRGPTTCRSCCTCTRRCGGPALPHHVPVADPRAA